MCLMAQRADSDSEMGDADDLVETLVAGRQKRRTAGNRLHHVLQEEADDEVTLLFAEDQGGGEEDRDFESNASEASDDYLDQSASSDEENPGARPDGDDYSGEREVKENEKVERAKQRQRRKPWEASRAVRAKAQKATNENDDAREVEPQLTETRRVAARPPNTNEGPIRSSSRKHTKLNTELVNQRAQRSEEQRKRHLEMTEAASKRKMASQAKIMTQADRLAEAARVERHNSKSLNRWEAAESRRLEEQRAKFAALRNRQLDGPVMTWWSGPSTWSGETLFATGAANVRLQRKFLSEERHPPTAASGLLESTMATPCETENIRSKARSSQGSERPSVEAGSRPFPGALQPLSTPHDHVDMAPTTYTKEDGPTPLAKTPQPPGDGATFAPSKDYAQNPRLLHHDAHTATRNLLILKNFDGGGAKTSGLQNILSQRRRGAFKHTSTWHPREVDEPH